MNNIWKGSSNFKKFRAILDQILKGRLKVNLGASLEAMNLMTGCSSKQLVVKTSTTSRDIMGQVKIKEPIN